MNMPFNNPDTSEWSDVDVRLKNVRFGVNQGYKDNDGNLPVCLLTDLVNENGQEREDQIFSIGAGYRAVDGGACVEHMRAKYNKGENLGFSKGSKGAVLLESLCEEDEAVQMLTERAEKTGGPRHAAFWEGMTLHLVEEEIEWGKVQEDGKRKSYKQPKATKLYGWDVEMAGDEDEGDDGGELPPAATGTFGLDDEQYQTLRGLVESSATYEDFVMAAYDLDIIGDQAVQTAVDDAAKGIWATK